MYQKLLPQKFRVIGLILITISISFFILNFFTSFEFETLKNVNLPFPIPTMFPKVDGVGVNLNQSLFETFLLLGLLFITICKQQVENEKTIEIRVNTFIIVSKIFVIVNILSLIIFWGVMYLYVLVLNLYFQLVVYNIIFYYKVSKLK